ncbi:hypothetical protein RSX31_22805 [Rossellomorea sp. YC4-1]|nr:hypothetical protein [Rossellomorea sp. YC4-1]
MPIPSHSIHSCDPTFILIGAGVFLVAILEKQLANSCFIFFAAAIDSILKLRSLSLL